LNFVQVDFAGVHFNFGLIRDVVLDIRFRAASDRQSDAKDAKDAEATFHLDTPKLIQLHYNKMLQRKPPKQPTGEGLSGLGLHNKLAIAA
jgi:hypothetical protein